MESVSDSVPVPWAMDLASGFHSASDSVLELDSALVSDSALVLDSQAALDSESVPEFDSESELQWEPHSAVSPERLLQCLSLPASLELVYFLQHRAPEQTNTSSQYQARALASTGYHSSAHALKR